MSESLRTYCVLAVPVGLLLCVTALFPISFQSYSTDCYHHIAVLRELVLHPFHPENPHINTSDTSRYFTPRFVLLGIIGHFAGLSAEAVFSFAAFTGLGTYFCALYFFARKFWDHPWAPAFLLFSTLTIWGMPLFSFTGGNNLASLAKNLPYPSTFAFSLALLGYALVRCGLETPKLSIYAGLILCSGLSMLEHQLSALFGLGLMGCAIFFAAPEQTFPVRFKLGLCVLLGLGLALFWPYYSYLQIFLLSGTDSKWGAEWYDEGTIPGILILLGPSLLGLVGIAWMARSLQDRHFLIAFFGLFSVLVATSFLGHAMAHRLLFFVVFLLHIGCTAVLVAFSKLFTEDRTSKLCALVIGCLFFVPQLLLLWTLAARTYDSVPHPSKETLETINYLRLAKCLKTFLPENALVVGFQDSVYPVQAVGVKVFSLPRPVVFVPAHLERQEKTHAFFSDAPDRRSFLEETGVTHAVFAPEDLNENVASQILSLGPAWSFDDKIILVDLREPKAHGSLVHLEKYCVP